MLKFVAPIETIFELPTPEDIIFSLYLDTDNISIFKPSLEEAKQFSIESIYSNKSFGIHKAYNYIDIYELSIWCPDILELKRLNMMAY